MVGRTTTRGIEIKAITFQLVKLGVKKGDPNGLPEMKFVKVSGKSLFGIGKAMPCFVLDVVQPGGSKGQIFLREGDVTGWSTADKSYKVGFGTTYNNER